MERAGAAVAFEAMRVFPHARRFAVVCGGGSNGGDGRVAARVLRDAGREAVETDVVEGCDVVIDALFGTGFHGEPRPGAAAIIERINACGLPVVAIDLPSGIDASTGEVAGPAVNATLTVTFQARRSGSTSRRAGSTPERSSSPTSAWPRSRRWSAVRCPHSSGRCRSKALATRSSRRARCWSSGVLPVRPERRCSPLWRRCGRMPATSPSRCRENALA